MDEFLTRRMNKTVIRGYEKAGKDFICIMKFIFLFETELHLSLKIKYSILGCSASFLDKKCFFTSVFQDASEFFILKF